MNKDVYERPEDIPGKTYKIRSSGIDEAVYVTICDAVIDGVCRPVEIYINSKHMQSFQWVSYITRLVSKVLTHSEEFPEYVVTEMIETYDPGGRYMIPKSGGKWANGLVSHIGVVLEAHCKELGLMGGGGEK